MAIVKKVFHPKVATNELGVKEKITTRWDVNKFLNNTWIVMSAKFDSPCDDPIFFMKDHIRCDGIKQGDTIIFHVNNRTNKKTSYHPDCAYSHNNLLMAETISLACDRESTYSTGFAEMTEEDMMDRLAKSESCFDRKAHYAKAN